MLQGHQLLPRMSGISFSGMPQQVPLQIPHWENHDNQMNQTQLTVVQSSGLSSTPMPLSTNMAVLHEQQLEFVQSSDQIHGNTVVSSPENAIPSTHQTYVNDFQQGGISTLPQLGLGLLPLSTNNFHSNTSSLQNEQRLNHHHGKCKEHLLQISMRTPQQKEQFEQHCIHPQLSLEKDNHPLLLQQQKPHKQHLPQKLLRKHRMSQLYRMSNEVSDMNVGQGPDFVVSQMSLQSHQYGPQRLDLQQPPKATGLFTNSAQLLQPQSSQISEHSPPQTGQQNLHNSFTKTGTPMHTANSPFIPSPSITSTAPSSISEDPEKITPGVSSISNADNVGSEQMGLLPRQPQTLAIMDTPVMPPVSPSLSEFTAVDSNQRNTAKQETDCAAECQLERLCRVVMGTEWLLRR